MNYITLEGFQRLTQEASYLWKVKRPGIVKALSDAAAEGDRSENAEYIYRKKELRETDRKIRFLEKQLKDIQVVRDKPRNTQKVFFGAWITLETLEGQTVEYRIVGGIEARLEHKEISVHSPVAKGLLGKNLGDEVVISLPNGTQVEYEITNIRY